MDENQPDLLSIHRETKKLNAVSAQAGLRYGHCRETAQLLAQTQPDFWCSPSTASGKEKAEMRWAELVKSYFPSCFIRAKSTVHFHSSRSPNNWKDNRLLRIQCQFWLGKRIHISLHCNWAQIGLSGMLKKYQWPDEVYCSC